MITVKVDEACDLLTNDIIDCLNKLKNNNFTNFISKEIIMKKKNNITQADINYMREKSSYNGSSQDEQYVKTKYLKWAYDQLIQLEISETLKSLLNVPRLGLKKKILCCCEEVENLNIESYYLDRDLYFEKIELDQNSFNNQMIVTEVCVELKKLFEYMYKTLIKDNNFISIYSTVNNRDALKENARSSLKTCPYCNLELLKRNSMEIDHFVPFSKNPFYSITSYNLIPSCNECNSDSKKDNIFTPNIHPQKYNFFELTDINVDTNIQEITIRSRSDVYQQHIQNYLELFKIEDRINDDHFESIMRSYYHSDKKIKEAGDSYQEYIDAEIEFLMGQNLYTYDKIVANLLKTTGITID